MTAPLLAGCSLLSAALAAGPGPAPEPVLEALRRALAVPEARIELTDYRPALPAGCALDRAEVPRAVEASGRAAVHLLGQDGAGAFCDGWAWASVRVTGPVLSTSRRVNEGEPLEGAVRVEERELRMAGPRLTRLPPGATAARPIPAGTPLDEAQLRLGPKPGEAVAVSIRLGALSVEQRGRALPCGRGRACAILPSGKRVEGRWQDGRLIVEPL